MLFMLGRAVGLIALALSGLPGSLAAQARPSVTAVRADVAPVLDGLGNDAVWHQAPSIAAFREIRPQENGEPRQRTAFQVAYDARYLYVLVRAWDSHPDSLVAMLSRRDDFTPSDQIGVLIDSYHDRRSGYEFFVNPAGVRFDAVLHGDGNEDDAWDGIWDVATAVDAEGWSAEFRIPFSQLRYATAEELTFGLAVWRFYPRAAAEMSWPGHRPSEAGLTAQFGDLTGLRDLASPRRLEVVPYLLAQSDPGSTASAPRRQSAALGGDLRYTLAPNVTLSATLNPDFGQVESDPGELNLSAFETFLRERRPFFVEGSGLFTVNLRCYAANDCSTGERLFYSRRIGRAPELAGRYGDASTPTATRILGAVKLTGQTRSGLSWGAMHALSDRVAGSEQRTAEPRTQFSVLRANQNLADGEGGLGVMATRVGRQLDEWTTPFMHRTAWSGGVDAWRRIGAYQVSASMSGSHIAGDPRALLLTQMRSAHYFQRPDQRATLDSGRTSLTGSSLEITLGKVRGSRLLFETAYGRRSAGFETNDMGFLLRAGDQSWYNWVGLRFRTPTPLYRQINWNANWWQDWTIDGLPTDRSANTNLHVQFKNGWWFRTGGTRRVGTTWCDRNCTRGGPALRTDPSTSAWLSLQGDDRLPILPLLSFGGTTSDGGRSDSRWLSPELHLKPSSRLSARISVDYSRNRKDAQWFGNLTASDGTVTHTFAQLRQQTLGMTWRGNYTFTPTMSLQVHANPFIAKGRYANVRELADPRAPRYPDRFRLHAGPAAERPGGFNVQELRANAVFRWEYRPGSTLFLVWSQGREHATDAIGDRSFRGDLAHLFDQPAENRFLVKLSYWLNR